jgi:hypothetical protein
MRDKDIGCTSKKAISLKETVERAAAWNDDGDGWSPYNLRESINGTSIPF